jgi:hypothetical protein
VSNKEVDRMFLEIKCPKCGKKYFVDVVIEGLDMVTFQGEEERIQFVAENIKVKGVLLSSVLLKNL